MLKFQDRTSSNNPKNMFVKNVPSTIFFLQNYSNYILNCISFITKNKEIFKCFPYAEIMYTSCMHEDISLGTNHNSEYIKIYRYIIS